MGSGACHPVPRLRARLGMGLTGASRAPFDSRHGSLPTAAPRRRSEGRRTGSTPRRMAGRRGILRSARGVAQFGSALRSGRRGRWFESSRPDHSNPSLCAPVRPPGSRARCDGARVHAGGHGRATRWRASSGPVAFHLVPCPRARSGRNLGCTAPHLAQSTRCWTSTDPPRRMREAPEVPACAVPPTPILRSEPLGSCS